MPGDASFLAKFAEKQAQIEVVLGLVAEDDPPTVHETMADAVPAYRSFLSDHAEVTALFQSGDRNGAKALALGRGSQFRAIFDGDNFFGE